MTDQDSLDDAPGYQWGYLLLHEPPSLSGETFSELGRGVDFLGLSSTYFCLTHDAVMLCRQEADALTVEVKDGGYSTNAWIGPNVHYSVMICGCIKRCSIYFDLQGRLAG